MPELLSSTADTVSRDLESSWRDVRARLDAACAAAGRATDEVRLLPVSKSVDVDAALALHALGAREFGENRVDELERKAARFAALGREARWHFIGNLQRNKARRVVLAADVIHSVSTPKLLEALARVAAEEGRRPEIYLEVHLSGEDEKQGFAEDELRDAVALAGASHELRLLGLMTMAPRPEPDDVEGRAARRTFERCAELARELATEQPGSFEGGVAQLSMGMTGDLEQAVAAGSTCVRVGSAIFAAGGDA